MLDKKKSVLTVDRLTKIFSQKKWFGKNQKSFVAVNNISFTLHEGEILGFLGPNGAGKTTTIQMLLSLMTPTSGVINYFGKNFFTHRSEILQHISFASAYTKLPGRLTIYENLDIYGRIYGLSAKERALKIEEYLTLFGMWEVRHKYAGPLSAGQMTRVMLAKAFLAEPKIVLLDEPTASLDPDVAEDVRKFIVQQQRDRNISVLFTSHNMAEVEQICDRVLILKNGIIIADNKPQEIAASISKTRVNLMIETHDFAKVQEYVHQRNWRSEIKEHFIEIQVDEHDVASLLVGLAKVGVDYSQISIEKPTLEDYFLHILKKN
jgi:ABC-2 type transport system ATP-binding protein